MVITYDRNPNRTQDEKLESLIQNLMLAFSEIENRLDQQDKRIEELTKQLESIGS